MNFFEEIEKLIERGKTRTAKKQLFEIRLGKLNTSQTLIYCQLCRRLGLFDLALKNLAPLAWKNPVYAMESAICLGELGSLRTAIDQLQKLEHQIDHGHFRFYFHLANFLSLGEFYDLAQKKFAQMLQAARSSYETLLARLNLLGTRVYLVQGLDATVNELLEVYRHSCDENFQLLQQGSLYFLARAEFYRRQYGESRQYLAQARNLGRIHKLRENLMIDLLDFKLNIFQGSLELKALRQVKKGVLDQGHFWYFKEFLLGQLIYFHHTKRLGMVEKTLAELRVNSLAPVHLRSIEDLLGAALPAVEFWIFSKERIQPVGRKALSRGQVDCFQLPLLRTPGGPLTCRGKEQLIIDILLRRREFGIHEAELWEEVWQTPYEAEKSSQIVRQHIYYMRKKDLSKHIHFECKNRRLKASLLKGVKWYSQGSPASSIKNCSSA